MEDSGQSDSSRKLLNYEDLNASTEVELEKNREMEKNLLMLKCDALNMGMMMSQPMSI